MIALLWSAFVAGSALLPVAMGAVKDAFSLDLKWVAIGPPPLPSLACVVFLTVPRPGTAMLYPPLALVAFFTFPQAKFADPVRSVRNHDPHVRLHQPLRVWRSPCPQLGRWAALWKAVNIRAVVFALAVPVLPSPSLSLRALRTPHRWPCSSSP